MAFTHLHVHTEYSLLDGSCKIGEIAKKAAAMGMDSLAVTDHGVMYGAIDFYRACLENRIKPIIGCEVYVAPGSRFDREPAARDDVTSDTRYFHLILLAENNTGYSNLVKIVSKGFTEGFYYRPRVDLEVLKEYHEGIICLSACLAGEVARYLSAGMYDKAKETALMYRDIFGEGNYFLEMQDHGIADQIKVNNGLMNLSRETGIKLVATNDVHYINESDADAHDILLCLQTGKKLSDTNRLRYEGGQFYLKSEEEMKELFSYCTEAVERTHEIAQRCNVTIEFGVQKLPKFPLEENVTSWDYLCRLCREGLPKRYGPEGYVGKDFRVSYQELEERLDYELNTIRNMGYVDYFLIVWDYIHFAREHGIGVGPGRGSAAGSLVSYCLGITNIDPIRYQLIFERFLNPERVSMPDIDVDFAPERRQEVIDYVVEKYGKANVAQIVTFGTLAAKGVIRDVARVMDLPYSLGDQIAKMIPNELNITIDKAMEMNRELANLYSSDDTVKTLIDYAKRLEGLPRHTSIHAAGVVICSRPVDEYVPLSRGSEGNVTTQYIMTTLEELGLLKMDFLGLRNLEVIQDAVRLVEQDYNISLDIDRINYDDKAVYDYIGTGKCEGIFQLESSGMKSFMKELKPENIEDVIAGIALYRPGPMDFIPKYLEGKNSKGEIVYDTGKMEPILAPTYGCIVYQEQVMQIVRDLAGYSWGRSDLVRRAMSKKKTYVMEKERHNFVYGNPEENVPGCLAGGIPEDVANKIYDEMIDFAKYAFNKSHAAAYAVVTYQTAYLKTYYPVEFMAALMTSVITNSAKVSQYIMDCRKMGVSILPPDINDGENGFSVKTLEDGHKAIRFGLSAIKGVGGGVVDRIINERKANGPYLSLRSFIERTCDKEVSKKVLEGLIKSGALDSLPGTRKQKMIAFPSAVDEINKSKKYNPAGQVSMFEFFMENPQEGQEDDTWSGDITFPDVGEYDRDTLLAIEKEILGIYISGHPLDAYEDIMNRYITANSSDFAGEEADENAGEEEVRMDITAPKVRDRQWVRIGGMIMDRSVKTTKKGQMMAFVTLEDLVGTVEVMVFPKEYETYRDSLEMDKRIFVEGFVSVDSDDQRKLIVQKIIPFDKMPKNIWVCFPDRETYQEREKEFLEILEPYEGDDSVVIYLKSEKLYKKLSANKKVECCDELLDKIRQFSGEDNVKVTMEKL